MVGIVQASKYASACCAWAKFECKGEQNASKYARAYVENKICKVKRTDMQVKIFECEQVCKRARKKRVVTKEASKYANTCNASARFKCNKEVLAGMRGHIKE